MINSILFICLGNICRSPMAEGLCKHLMPEKIACSAGIYAISGMSADSHAVRLMAEKGINISPHRAQRLVTWMMHEADLILTMDREQTRLIERIYPFSKDKVWRIGEVGDFDIPDPYLLGASAFRNAYDLIAHGIDDWVNRIGDGQYKYSERQDFVA